MRPSQILSAKRDLILALAAAHGASRVRVFGRALSISALEPRSGS